MTTPRLPIRNLPGVLADVQRLCGDGVAVRFAAAFGDSKLYIPKVARLRDDHPLVQTLGRRAARLIASRLGGEEYPIPTGRWSINHHNARLLRLAGWSSRPIARALALREGTVDRLTDDLEPAYPAPQPVTLRCPCCGRVYKLTPPAEEVTPVAAAEADDAFLARQPPLLLAAVTTGKLSVADLRQLDAATRKAP
ncbi:hypothetical protein [Azospirillum agricola]|uniref:hypothetical protein n=1 Tax=Azospirillum agricola TaxID=1720247 RepID=UPI000A0F2F5B|nr:hypothetical protein [Azospirillum agricola]MBP2231790.1 hypothetical protein [Azospirillum agricola]SMH62551.1 hypothetical protein SAMN02982994_6354 [Azospirillum lipoferum]